MSAAAVVSSLLSSAAVVAVPTVGAVLADGSANIPEPAKATIFLLSGLTMFIVFLANLGKALPVMRTMLAFGETKPTRAPDHPLPRDHASMLVTHGELEQHLRRIETKIDDNAEASRTEIKQLTATMTKCFADLVHQVGQLEGRALATKPPR